MKRTKNVNYVGSRAGGEGKKIWIYTVRKLRWSITLSERRIMSFRNQQDHIFLKPYSLETQEIVYSFESICKLYPIILQCVNASLIFENEQKSKCSLEINWNSKIMKCWNRHLEISKGYFYVRFSLEENGKNIYILIYFLGTTVISRYNDKAQVILHLKICSIVTIKWHL